MSPLVVVAEPATTLTAEGAKRLTQQLRAKLESGWELLVRAHAGRVWELLGYGDWESYLEAELGDLRLIRISVEQRREVVAAMAAARMPYRAIAAALGVSLGNIVKDLDAVAPDRPQRRRRKLAAVPQDVPVAEGVRVDQRVFAAVADQAEKGLTVHELCLELGMRQGAASASLTRLSRYKERIAVSGRFRDGCTVYVLPEHATVAAAVS